MSQLLVELEEVLTKVSYSWAPDSIRMWITSVDKTGHRHRQYYKPDEAEDNVLNEYSAKWFCKPKYYQDKEYDYIKQTENGVTVLGKTFNYGIKHKELYEFLEYQIKKIKSD